MLNKWSWKNLVLNQNKFYLMHNPIEEEDKVNEEIAE
jgi:hypothetical protein